MFPQNLHVNIYTRFINKPPKMEMTQRFFTGEWINCVVHAFNDMPSSNKKQQTVHNNMNKS